MSMGLDKKIAALKSARSRFSDVIDGARDAGASQIVIDENGTILHEAKTDSEILVGEQIDRVADQSGRSVHSYSFGNLGL